MEEGHLREDYSLCFLVKMNVWNARCCTCECYGLLNPAKHLAKDQPIPGWLFLCCT